jgi:aminopeptidase N
MISFSEETLLYSEKEHSVIVKQEVALIIAHELAHFWFGNLVTMEWWNELWLNEAMATFFEFKAIEKIYPDMDTVLYSNINTKKY